MHKLMILILLFCLFFLTSPAWAAMKSSNYRIESDVISGVGGETESAAYLLQQSLLALSHGQSKGTNYGQVLGFLSQVNTTLTLSLDSNSINFGSVAPLGSATDQSTISVTTDAWNGYYLYIQEDQPLTHTDTIAQIPDYSGTIESPTSWSGTGFGFTVNSGTCADSKWNSGANYAGAPQTQTELHNTKRGDARNCPGYQAPSQGSDNTVLGFKVVPGDWQKAGSYSNNITITVTATL